MAQVVCWLAGKEAGAGTAASLNARSERGPSLSLTLSNSLTLSLFLTICLLL